jgi:UDP-N-acetylmuramyl-tripeptide synthetase
MRLQELLSESGCFTCERYENPEIRGVNTDSRKITDGDLFIAIPGYRDDGTRYIEDALVRGAAAVLVDVKLYKEVKGKIDLPLCTALSPRYCALLLSRILYGYPAQSLRLIGVTGTNGKTTVTYLLEAMLMEAGLSPGVIGTISYRWSDKVLTAHNTTPDPVEIQKLMVEMKKDGIDHVIMEVSSHALAMNRVFPPDFGYALFTNLSQDHLDFHKSMDEYFDAKAILFEGLGKDGYAVINLDDDYGKRLIRRTPASVVTYGVEEGADYRGHDPELSIEGTSFSINGTRFRSSLVGLHNIYNILASVALISHMGFGTDLISKALSRVKGIPGRFERAVEGRCFHVFVDYAHTPDALAHLLEAANSLKSGRIITVFGCGGDRDRGKRPKMGRVVEENSDIAIVTSDNPRTEDPIAIINDIREGLRTHEHIIIPDRREAIYRAIELAEEDDIVLIAGKGHEDYQILGERTIHFDDREVAAEAVRDLGK